MPTPPSFALLVIDHARLQHAAWAEFHTARKRLDKAMRELHRHEEIDVPAYDAWLHRTFPFEVTSLRELNEEVETKARQIKSVRAFSARTGRSAHRLWREQKERAANPEAFRKSASRDDADEAGRRSDAHAEDFEPKPAAPRSAAARDIYRRLVQRLHPDSGGEWTSARQHLWHEVQQAWAAGDSDWLARLEVEWETAHSVVGPNSPLSRLRAAIEELDAARRDTELKSHAYRSSLQWRFTLTPARRPILEARVKASFAREFATLRRQLHFLNATLATWEEDWTSASSRPKPKRRRFTFQNTGPRSPRS